MEAEGSWTYKSTHSTKLKLYVYECDHQSTPPGTFLYVKYVLLTHLFSHLKLMALHCRCIRTLYAFPWCLRVPCVAGYDTKGRNKMQICDELGMKTSCILTL